MDEKCHNMREKVIERTFHQVTRLDNVRVRMVNGDVEAERLQQHVLIEDQVLRLFQVRVLGRLLAH